MMNAWGRRPFLGELCRSVFSWRFSLGVLLCCLIAIPAGWLDVQRRLLGMNDGVDAISMFAQFIGFSPIMTFLPTLCVLPSAINLCDDIRSGYFYHIVYRQGRLAFVRTRLLTCAISGGAIVFFGLTLLFWVCCILFPMPVAGDPNVQVLYEISPFRSLLKGPGSMWIYMLFQILMPSLFGMVWAVVGMTLAVIKADRYLVLGGPFLIVLSLFYLSSALRLNIMNPIKLAYPAENDQPILLLLNHALIFLFCWYIFQRGIARRIAHG